MDPLATFRAKAPPIMAALMSDFPIGLEDAAAIVGNLGHESGGFTKLQEISPTVAGSRGGYGWPQWTGPRRRAYEAYCARNRLDPASDRANYAYLFVELKGSERKAIPRTVAASGLDAKVEAFEKAFERAGVKHYASRKVWARRALAAWHSASAEERTPNFLPAPITIPESGAAVDMPDSAEPEKETPMPKGDLSPIEETNKANKGGLSGLGGGTMGGALIYLWSLTSAFPAEWASDPQAIVALTTVAATVTGAITAWIGAYRAIDKRFQSAE